MLRQRVWTASILATIVLLSIFYFSTPVLSIFFGLISLVAAWEWSKLCGVHTTPRQSAYLIILIVCGLVLYLAFGMTLELMIFAVAWWIWSLLNIRRDRAILSNWQTLVALIAGAIMIVPAWYGLSQVHALFDKGPLLLVVLLMTVWLADIGAYTAGKLWGKRPLALSISPGKTVEGFIGGMFVVSIFGFVAGKLILGLEGIDLLLWVLLVVTTGLFSVLGDLVESKAKRAANVKDSSSILPGHGGVLDRVDSLLAATPVFLLGCLIYFPTLPRS